MDEAGQKARNADTASENYVAPSAETSADKDGVFCCRDCGESFREEANFLEHRHQHLQESMYLNNQLDGLHDPEKDNEKDNFCNLCSLSFVETSEFHLHMEKNHGQTLKRESDVQISPGTTKQHTYECPDCGKCYGVIGHFLNHQRSHRQASKSLSHDLEHLKKKSFQCESCGRNYSRASALDAHRRCHEEKLVKSRNRSSGDVIHTEESTVEANPSESQIDNPPEKHFKCSCGKAFTSLVGLKTHRRFSRKRECSPEDTKEKPKKGSNEFSCNECNKAFNGHIALFNHQRWHANHSKQSAQRFPCEECGKVFMTLTFYYRHQRMAHSDETPAKSFLHQVCQIQKKAFECKDCGLKFSRASALHSHQLHHTDIFKETEKGTEGSTSLLPQQNTLENERKETKQEQMESENVLPASMAGEDSQVIDTDDDMDSYELGDFNVQVISASESEEEPVQDLNPDLELLCESDQEIRHDGDAGVSPSSLVVKPEMDLKIVQIDFEQAAVQCAQVAEREAEDKTSEARFDCPDCYRWFSSASSLRVHRMWHGIRKRRQQTQGQSVAVHTCDTCGHQASNYAAHCSHIQKHRNQNTNNDTLYQAEGLEKNNLTCNECGQGFSHLSALVSHQANHPKSNQFQCPDCMMSHSHAASLFNHMKNCSARKKENISVSKKEYNPKKTLLGPKIYHCEHCQKGFWSIGAYSYHMQSQTQCADLRLRKGVTEPLHSVDRQSRSSVKVACPVCGRKFRHKRIMALHMRKHENGNHKCELCNRSFRLFSSLLRHQVVHNDQLLPPPIKSFQHQVEQLKKNTYSCPDCGKLFSRAKALQFHLKSHGYETGHSPSSPRSNLPLEELQCPTCLAHFNSKASLRAHKKLCINRESQAIVFKTEPSENIDTVKLHKVNINVGTKESSKRIKVKTEVKNDMDREERNKEDQIGVVNVVNPSGTDLNYKCKKCDRSFSVVGALNSHKRIHEESTKPLAKAKLSLMRKKAKEEEPGKGLFHCIECGKRFMSNSALGSHKRLHKDKKYSQSLQDDDMKFVSWKAESGPFQCPQCGKQFFNHCVLQRHQMFNPQCQIKTETELDSDKNMESNRTLENVPAEDSPLTPKKSPVSRGMKKIRLDLQPENSISCLDCGKQCISAGVLLDHKKVCPEVNYESKKEIQTSETTAEISPLLSRMSEQTAKCLFKCDKCGKAFQTEEQLRTHKSRAKSRPYCCALCCHGFWTENQLQQHLAWHDEVRCRLPNEVRYRLSTAMTSKPLKLNIPFADIGGKSSPSSTLNPDSQSQSSQKCHHCDEAFLSPTALQKHITQHCNNDSYHCSFCPRTFSEIQDLIDHHQECIGDHKRHSDAPAAFLSGDTNGLTCLECGTTFCQETDLHQHYVEHARGV